MSSLHSAKGLTESEQAIRSTVAHQILFTCFCNAKGLPPTLNWAIFAAQSGIQPVVGIDGPAPLQPESTQAWSETNALFFLLPPFEEALAAATTTLDAAGANAVGRGLRFGRLKSAARARWHKREASRGGFQFWLVRWYSVLRLLEFGSDILLSDSDVVWHRDPRPYLRAVSAVHPLLDVLIHSDHSVYAEDLREDLPYASAASLTRQQLLSRYQTIQPLNTSSGGGVGQIGQTADFDLDPRPAAGYTYGTWNPGLLFVRSTRGGRDMIGAWAVDFADKGRRRVKPHEQLSSQSEMNRFLTAALGKPDNSTSNRHPRDPLLFSVPLGGALSSGALGGGGRSGGQGEATLGLFPPLQFGSFAATHLVREARLYGAAVYASHATQIVGDGIVFTKNNAKHMGRCTHPQWCLGSRRVTAAAVKAFTLRHFSLWKVPMLSAHPPHAVPSHPVPFHPSNPIPFRPIPSHPIPSRLMHRML